MIRVLHLVRHLTLGGYQSLIRDLVPLLARQPFEPAVCCLTERGDAADALERAGIDVHCIGKRRGPDVVGLSRLAALLSRTKVDILHMHAFSAGLWGRAAGIIARTPVRILTVHAEAGWLKPTKHRFFNTLLNPATDKIVAVSEKVRQSLIEKERTDPDLISVIPNGVDAERFRRSERKDEDRAALGLPPGAPLIGMVARCRREKGGECFVEALALLAKEGISFHAVIVGDGPDRDTWRRLAGERGLDERLTFAGSRTNVSDWLAVLDVGVVPSYEESFGLTALEMMASSVPVVATRTGGIPEIADDEENALLVEPRDPQALADAIRILLNDTARAGRLAESGRAHVADRFTIRSAADSYLDVYRFLAARHPRLAGKCV